MQSIWKATRVSAWQVSGKEAKGVVSKVTATNIPVSNNAEPHVAELDRRPRLWHGSVILGLTTFTRCCQIQGIPSISCSPFLCSHFTFSYVHLFCLMSELTNGQRFITSTGTADMDPPHLLLQLPSTACFWQKAYFCIIPFSLLVSPPLFALSSSALWSFISSPSQVMTFISCRVRLAALCKVQVLNPLLIFS